MRILDLGKFGAQRLLLPEPCTSLCAMQVGRFTRLVAASATRRCLLTLYRPEADEEVSDAGTGEPGALVTIDLNILQVLEGPQLRGGRLMRSLRGDVLVSYGLDGQVMCGAVNDWVCLSRLLGVFTLVPQHTCHS